MKNFTAFSALRGFATKRVLGGLFLAGVALSAGAAVVAGHGAAAGWHGHGGMAMAFNADDVTGHVDAFLQHVYGEVGASDAQKAQLEPLVKQAAADLLALHNQAKGGHAQLLAALTQEHVDRAALEASRVAHVDTLDQASRRITQLVGDVADVLTVEQRRAVAARIAEHHGLQHD